MNEIKDEIENIQQKLGDDNFPQISEEVNNIRTKYEAKKQEIEAQQKKIADLEKINKDVIETNGKLFLQLGEQANQPFQGETDKKEVEEKKIQLSDFITASGNLMSDNEFKKG